MLHVMEFALGRRFANEHVMRDIATAGSRLSSRLKVRGMPLAFKCNSIVLLYPSVLLYPAT